MRVLVTGSREWLWPEVVWKELAEVYSTTREPMVVVHGGCPKGADFQAALWCNLAEVTNLFVAEERHPAHWKNEEGRYIKQAGFIRNREMVEAGADLCLAFIYRESKGATMTAKLAERSGIETRRFVK